MFNIIVQIRADPPLPKGMDLICPPIINYLDFIKQTNTPEVLSVNIPNPDNHRAFFQHLSEIITQSCKTIESVQLNLSPIHPFFLVHQSSKLMEKIDELYKGNENLESMKKNIQITKDKLIEYGLKIAHLEFHLPIRGSSVAMWIENHSDYFEKVTNDDKLIEYLKDIKRNIGDVQKSIQKHRSNIDEKSLTELNADISKSASNFLEALKNKIDLNGPLSKINEALDAVMNNEKTFEGLKTNVEKIKHDLMELKMLMEKQRRDIDQYFKTQTFPDEKPKINLVE